MVVDEKQPYGNQTQPAHECKRPADAHCINHILQERDRDGRQRTAHQVTGSLSGCRCSIVLVYQEGVVDLGSYSLCVLTCGAYWGGKTNAELELHAQPRDELQAEWDGNVLRGGGVSFASC